MRGPLATQAVAALVILLVGLALWSVAALFAWRTQIWKGDDASVSSELVILASSIGTLVGTALTGLLTWQLVRSTDAMTRATQVMADLERKRDEERTAIPDIFEDEFNPIVEPDDAGGDGIVPELRVKVRNIGNRPLHLSHVLVEDEEIHPVFNDEGDFLEMDLVPTVYDYPLTACVCTDGQEGPLPPLAIVEWCKHDHGIEWDGSSNGYRVGVKTSDGRQFWAPRRHKRQPSAVPATSG